MMTPKHLLFKEIAENCDCKYYGPYQGRGGHTGIAITIKDDQEYTDFIWECQKQGLEKIAKIAPHKDQLGLKTVCSWPTGLFEWRTYRDLFNYLKDASDSVLDSNLTVYIEEQDEYFPAVVGIEEEDGVLDADHIYFEV